MIHLGIEMTPSSKVMIKQNKKFRVWKYSKKYSKCRVWKFGTQSITQFRIAMWKWRILVGQNLCRGHLFILVSLSHCPLYPSYLDLQDTNPFPRISACLWLSWNYFGKDIPTCHLYVNQFSLLTATLIFSCKIIAHNRWKSFATILFLGQ